MLSSMMSKNMCKMCQKIKKNKLKISKNCADTNAYVLFFAFIRLIMYTGRCKTSKTRLEGRQVILKTSTQMTPRYETLTYVT